MGYLRSKKWQKKIKSKLTEVVQEEPKVETPEVSKEKVFTEAEVGEIIENRIARERSNLNKKLGVNDIDVAVNAVKTQKELEEKKYKRVSLKKF